MDSNYFPKVLILSRGVWNEKQGTSSTLTNFFEDFDPSRLAQVYIETIEPDTRCCNLFFQISEISLVHKLYKWKLKTGRSIDKRVIDSNGVGVDKRMVNQEAEAMSFFRNHRSLWFSLAREILWSFGGWKSDDLRAFINDFNPDVIWIDGSALPFLNKVFYYIMKVVNKPAVIFMQDDIYTYKSCPPRIISYFYKWLLRRQVRKVVNRCNEMFVASPKMKKEYDEIFGVNSTFIAKSSLLNEMPSTSAVRCHQPIRMVYMGQIIYGRVYTLVAIAQTLMTMNKDNVKVELHIYTNNKIPAELTDQLLVKGCVYLEKPVPYQEVHNVITTHDIVLFVESFDSRYNKLARLSFSTKIFDYLTSGKCVFAVGPADSAPIEYFKKEDAAIVADSIEDIKNKIKELENEETVRRYSLNALQCARKNHDRAIMNRVIYGKLIKLAQVNVNGM